MQSKLLLLFLISSSVTGVKKCIQEKMFLRFYKVKSCHKSMLPVVSRKYFDHVQDCKKFARDKNGFAFNFGHPELTNSTENRWFANCQVLGCPETGNSTLVFDPTFDYYTAYGDFNSTVNSTCIKSIGLFNLIEQKMNYTTAINVCQHYGGDLANILSESRTNALAGLLKPMKNWYKAAYVGLDKMEVEGSFQTAMGNFMQCGTFTAWAAGHPRPNRTKEKCVILDMDRTWRAINCKITLSFICEFYPAPPTLLIDFSFKNCTGIKNKRKIKQCLANNELVQLYNNSTRIDQCALLND